jgi:hypothetical protein
MIAIKAARPKTLFIQIFVRNNEHHVPTRLDQQPPFFQGVLDILHVLQRVRAVDAVVAFLIAYPAYVVSVPMLHIEQLRPRRDGVVTASYVNHLSQEVPTKKLFAPEFVRF